MKIVNPTISIILPVYNVDKYLCSTLDSIISQTFIFWECLLIDDGSKDSSGLICDEYASKDSRFRVFHKENGGVSSARNTGLENAKGEWITFCDGDDELFADTLEYYANIISNYDVEIIRCGYRKRYESGKILDIVAPKESIISDKQDILLTCEGEKYWGFLWNSCIKSTIAQKHRFDPSISWSEDHIFIYECMYESKYIYITSKLAYVYNIVDLSRKKTLSTKHKDYKMLEYVADKERELKMKFYRDSDIALSYINKEYNNVIILAIKEALYSKCYKEAYRISRKTSKWNYLRVFECQIYYMIKPFIGR
jgi:glycosyltransferase involved in cell wall biosynthesis